MPNRLASEQSLYLRQHADHPVDWWPWSPEAFATAKRENKPVLVSIGYSSCHWCHVMAEECFENAYIAKLMNQHFVCIKVDREERPDVDQVYMEAVMMIVNHGGWPLHVFCLPDGRPFFGGTYFPPEDRGQGIIPWPQLLMRIAEHFRTASGELEDNAAQIARNMHLANSPGEPAALPDAVLLSCAKAICTSHDDAWGGFGGAPKFPPSMTLDFLLQIRATAACESDPAFARRVDQVLSTTLRCMARGGLYDQLAGGFSRYSVDRFWLVPHFEKMLYDNGLLLSLFARAFTHFRQDLMGEVAIETAEWLLREMRLEDGTLAASVDADSEGGEGAFYVWSPDEIASVLDRHEAEAFCKAYHVGQKGSFEGAHSVLALNDAHDDTRRRLKDARAKLLAARLQRPAPVRDNKRLVAWNALAVRGLCEAAWVFDRPDFFRAALCAAEVLWQRARHEQGQLAAVLYEDGARNPGCLDDYALLAEACLSLAAWGDLYEKGTSTRWIARAETLARHVMAHFCDKDAPGFFFTAAEEPAIVCRKKEWMDNAMPAGNSAMLRVCYSLHALTAAPLWAEQAALLRSAYAGLADRAPHAIAHALAGMTAAAMGIAVVRCHHVSLPALRDALAGKRWRTLFVRDCSDEAAQPEGYQLCVGPQCLPLLQDPKAVAALI